MSYYAALAEALRSRKCTEVEVREALAVVLETTVPSGTTPEGHFGPAKQYAENFTGTLKRSVGQVLRWLALPTAIVALILLRLWAFPSIEFFPWGALLGAGVFVVVWVLAEIVVSFVNRRIPNGFTVPSTAVFSRP